jgi:hypothetical protein
MSKVSGSAEKITTRTSGRSRQPPLYLLIKTGMVPRDSSVFAEIERIRATEDNKEIDDLVPADALRHLLDPAREIRVCGGSRWISVHALFMELRRLGFNVQVHERASYTLDYDGA